MTTSVETGTDADSNNGPGSLSLGTAAARNLATTTKSVPQMQGISSRWLLRLLSWVHVPGGTYRVNRRLTHTLGDGRVEFVSTGAEVRVIPAELGELPLLRGFSDPAVLEELAGRFTQREFRPGEVLVEAGQPADQVVLIAHGKVHKEREGEYGDPAVLGVLADGGYFGDRALAAPEASEWDFTVKAVTACTVLTLPRQEFESLLERSEELRSHVAAFRTTTGRPQNEHGEAAIDVASGHSGEPALPGVFADYELAPREFGLSVAQTVLRVHTRVADLYNEPMNQVEQQLRLTIEALRERQEHDMVNNREFGLLHNADLKQRIHTRSGPPTPDDLDELLATVWKDPGFLLAHPRAIAAIAREFNSRGIYPDPVQVGGHSVPAWRGVPIFPCNKIPVTDNGVSSILAMRTGEDAQGVVGLHRTGIPDEYRPGLSVRFMGISEQAIISYLVSAYYSAAVLVPDALGILENVEVGH
ncbi:family 2B encapsulin nanocompartment shell protein [Streptomyces albireticuli]|uniref:Crp/Fnr family transcriptional regulator n=1 Tax=Streptomyces albireticuli TaxID=1940 RepID=A0A2A2D6E4_9ACTN|nr:family 2B encapsulin nanocompartment shell protein [Streptomyces albireticuli]MCD9141214.1 cyclic nucleotide-binding domain-containing protein [Streptomyces albireticuli]MCD9160825.1 cyclic nucleotide-binding domain-containing protein [Streptomyces albireticuli]MCD9191118.1 cyclic nucleotide-binding domain-containing protein [Streptomyces albireticuli]PAU47095.1 Crp/Fnr family transcriptional regulator [Streptomyces albireticuli]